MPAGIVVELQFETVSVEVPTLVVNEETVRVVLPELLSGGRLDLGRLRIPLGDVSLGSVSASLSVPTIGFRSIDLPGSITVPTVDFFPGSIGTQSISIPTPFGQVSITVIDPTGFRLPSVDVGFRSQSLPGFQLLPVPEPGFETVTISLPAVSLPDINQDLGSIRLPSVGPKELARFRVPTVQTNSSALEVPDPATLELLVDVDTDTLADELLPDGSLSFLRDTNSAVLRALTDTTGVATELFTDTASYVFETVFAELESRVTVDVAERIRRLAEGFLQLLLSDETKQELRQQRREE